MPDTASATSPVGPEPRVWFNLGAIGVTTTRLLLGAALLLVLAIALTWSRIDLPAIHARAQQWPGWAVMATISIAPLLGVPVAMLHVVAGVRFGLSAGLLVVALATLVHHISGYTLVRLAPRVFARRLVSWRKRFPRGAHTPLTIFSCLLPGMPYTIQLYLLPVLGVPLRVLLRVSLPLHTLRAIVSLLIGDMSDELTPAKLAALATYYLVLTVACTLAFRHIRRELRQPNAAPERPTRLVRN